MSAVPDASSTSLPRVASTAPPPAPPPIAAPCRGALAAAEDAADHRADAGASAHLRRVCLLRGLRRRTISGCVFSRWRSPENVTSVKRIARCARPCTRPDRSTSVTDADQRGAGRNHGLAVDGDGLLQPRAHFVFDGGGLRAERRQELERQLGARRDRHLCDGRLRRRGRLAHGRSRWRCSGAASTRRSPWLPDARASPGAAPGRTRQRLGAPGPVSAGAALAAAEQPGRQPEAGPRRPVSSRHRQSGRRRARGSSRVWSFELPRFCSSFKDRTRAALARFWPCLHDFAAVPACRLRMNLPSGL